VADVLRPESPPRAVDRLRSALVGLRTASRRRPAQAAGALVLALVGVAVAVWLLRAPASPAGVNLPLARSSSSGPARSSAGSGSSVAPATALTSAASWAEVVVQAAGAVVHPGVYRLPSGARVVDLLQVAGGLTADADPESVALAARLADGARIVVPTVAERRSGAAPAPAAGAPSGAASTGAVPVDLNTATADQLATLPGIGPSLAQAIVDHRDRAGPFASVEGLLDVRGIGPAKLEAVRDLVRV